MNKSIVILATGLMALSLSAANLNTSGNWEDPATWGGTKPATPITGNISLYNNATVTMSSADTISNRLTIANAATSGTLVLNSGAYLTANDRVYVGDRNTINDTSIATLKVSGGTLDMAGGQNLWIGNGQQDALNGRGIIEMTAGAIKFTAATPAYFNIGINNGSSTANSIATYSQTGGALTGNVNLSVGTSKVTEGDAYVLADFALKGGTLLISGTASFGNTGAANSVIKATISSLMDSVYFEGNVVFAGGAAGTTLTLDIAQLADWSDKNIFETAGKLTINGTSGVVVDFANFGLWDNANVGDTITLTLVEYGSLSKTSATADIIANLDTDHFSTSAINWGASAATIDVTYTNLIPEPAASAALLGLLGLAFVARRRK